MGDAQKMTDQTIEPGGFYLSPPQVDGIIAALERFIARMDRSRQTDETAPGEEPPKKKKEKCVASLYTRLERESRDFEGDRLAPIEK